MKHGNAMGTDGIIPVKDWKSLGEEGVDFFYVVRSITEDVRAGETTRGMEVGTNILGPLLFIIYTSDLPLCLPRECKLFMYADDSTITCSSSNINEIENNLNTALGSIYDWCARNKLTINANKTKSMLIGSKQKVHNTDLNVSIAGSSVVKVNCVKCLGVIIDESLSWGPHVEYVKKTVSSKLGMLNRIRNYVPHSSLLSLFVCLVTPSLDYCCTVWGGRYIMTLFLTNV